MGFFTSMGFGSPASATAAPAANPASNSNMQFGNQPNGANAPNANPATLPTPPAPAKPSDPNPAEPQKTVDPFDKFKGMFDNKAATDTAPGFTLDDKMLGDVAGAQDFMKGINPELVQKATSGDTGALMQMMNEVARNAYRSSLSHGSRLTESFVGAREGFSEKSFGKKVRGELTVNSLTGTPNFKNPVVREQLIRIANDLQQQHPDAAPEEIGNMAKDYITQLSNAINPASSEASQGNKPRGQTDFNDWFSEETH